VSFGDWWKRRSGGAKTVVVLAVLLILQIGLCFSSDSTVIPAYEAIFGASHDPEAGIGFAVVQAMLCGVTLVALLIAVVATANSGGFKARGDSKGDSHD
jgi:hypothetical protein